MSDRRYRFEDSVVVSDLKYWGYRKGKQRAADGSAATNTIDQIMSGRGGKVGHKVLCLDMPQRAWEINRRVFELPTDYISVLIARYCLPVKLHNGQPYESWELAELLDVELRTYQYRLTQARKCYKRLLFGAEIIALQPQVG